MKVLNFVVKNFSTRFKFDWVFVHNSHVVHLLKVSLSEVPLVLKIVHLLMRRLIPSPTGGVLYISTFYLRISLVYRSLLLYCVNPLNALM